MEIRIDPDIESKENMKLTIKILQAKYDDRFNSEFDEKPKNLGDKILDFVSDPSMMYDIHKIKSRFKLSQKEADDIIDDLTSCGILYRPAQGKVKLIE